ncbi:CDP-alcohol phosphatidyltransferase family protein [Nakamurella endophytica]|uniref:CDP-diacylglycerol--glycerol-3-phosphate 3-phosphatidyltransferase n=1 Tax=Nakamurella endophytica TaxID=1748367 RepID=A0A917T7X2_9ACTN|nr:CDP-alcohol phosphatidyltransferase family protein [Nakamurella endophytica]GGM13210.1 CDP-diacylglycerol--glycerol-3-phosphate 3-phosphatidyltransferase [Nakamurella endophytica]
MGEGVASPIPEGVFDRIWTVPNLLSFLRLLGVPLFLWLLLGPHADGWAIVVLAVSAVTDWADGKLARLLGQYSRLGELLDPLADRLYIFAALVGYVLRDFLPWWAAALLVGRDLVLTVGLRLVRRHGYVALPVNYVGKAATFCLLYGLPMLLLGQVDNVVCHVALPVAVAFTAWGILLYLWSGWMYLQQVRWVMRSTPLRPPVSAG